MKRVAYETQSTAVTRVEYQAFQDAYDFFNAELFQGGLPQVLVTMQRRAHSYGYLAPDRFAGRQTTGAVHELALNPDGFVERTDAEILSTLVHEMAHVWQYSYGTPSRRGYHNREWAEQMVAIGLYPSSTGKPGGKVTGQHMGHYILPDGPYIRAYETLQAQGFALHWQSAPLGVGVRGKDRNKTGYTCPTCKLIVWGKPAIHIICGACRVRMLDDAALTAAVQAQAAAD
jgi:hypothetical protein